MCTAIYISCSTAIGTISGGILNANGSVNPGTGFAGDGGIANWLVAETGSNTVTVSFTKSESYFGLLWGSMDLPNTIAFYNGSTLIASYTAAEIIADKIGAQGYPADASFIDFTSVAAASDFNKVVLSSGDDFEAVNYATLQGPSTIASLEPNSLDAGSAAFTLTVNGSKFVSGDMVEWNGVPLPTTYVSSAKLTAKVSAADVAKAGSAAVTVVETVADNVSSPAAFAIPLTSIVISSETIKTVAGGYSVTLTLHNTGFKAATNISLTGAYLATSEASTPLPVEIASIAPSGTKSVTLSFPSSVGKAGDELYLLLDGSYAGGGGISLSSLETLP